MRILILTDLKSQNEIVIQGPQYWSYLIAQGLNVRQLIELGFYELSDTLVELGPEKTWMDFRHKQYMDI